MQKPTFLDFIKALNIVVILLLAGNSGEPMLMPHSLLAFCATFFIIAIHPSNK